MPHINTRSRKPAAVALVTLLLACIGLTACGGSSSTTSTGANAAATGTASSTSSSSTPSTGTSSTGQTSPPAGGRGVTRFAAMRECLQKNGITLPKRTPGSRSGAGGGFPSAAAGGGPQLPKGMTRAQFEAALKKCGGGRGFAGGAGRRLNSPVLRAALAKYGTCLRQNGIKLPAPNTSGSGPIFSTKGINTSSPQFRAAATKCRTVLLGAFRRPAAGAPPA
jgi:hypothetical protein